ncbi:aminoglycoside phosphotransferase family protein [Gammaproteobacteria bacterium]|nr:aminoglycoside phosphotransferase family protein [Gammaproteobacteria bacterium]
MVFKANWERSPAQNRLSASHIDEILRMLEATPMQNITQGCSNINIPIQLAENDVILRIYCNDQIPALIENRVLEKISDKVLSPKVLACGQHHDYYYTIQSQEPGQLLRTLILDPSLDLSNVMYDIGIQLQSLGQWQFDTCGKFGQHLDILKPQSYSEQYFELIKTLHTLPHLTHVHCQNWESLFSEMSSLIPDADSFHLVHGDFDVSNILVKKTDQWVLSAILDWEFSRSGLIYQDIANMLRYSELPQHYQEAFMTGVTQHAPLPDTWRLTTRLCNVIALFDCLVYRTDIKQQPIRYNDVIRLLEKEYQYLSK